jgi:Ni/Co efflux regulator RcnB
VAVESLGGRELGEEAGGVETRQQGELAGRIALGDQQNQAEVDDTDDPMDKEATEALPAMQLEIDNHHFRLRGIRTQQLARRQTKTTQYRVVWGEHPNRSDSWVNEDDVLISILRLPCERSS